MYPSSPHTIHPPHIRSAILGESVINIHTVFIHVKASLIYMQGLKGMVGSATE